MKFFAIIASAAVATQVAAKPTFVKLIPGASNVAGVASVGHIDPAGGGPGNAFGADFAASETVWTVDLCYKDSDGDEQFNGAELGDPCCEWVSGSNEKLAYTTATAPGDKTSKQDPTIWAAVKCTNGEDPVTKYTAYMAKASGTSTTAPVAGTTTAPAASNTTAPAGGSSKGEVAASPVPTPTSGVSQAATVASAAAVAVVAFLM